MKLRSGMEMENVGIGVVVDRRKISNARKELWYLKQRLLREDELKQKPTSYSEAVKRRWADPEARAKMIAGMKGKKHARKSI